MSSPLPQAAPRTLDEFATGWCSFIRGFGYRLGVPVPELDDFVQDVVLWVCERDELDAYDPAVSRFTTWLGSLVVKRAHSFRTAVKRHRDELTLNSPISRDDAGHDRASLIPDPCDPFARSASAASIVEFHDHLKATDPVRAKLLGVLVEELAEPQASDYSGTRSKREINTRRVARKAGVSASRLNRELDALATAATEVGFTG